MPATHVAGAVAAACWYARSHIDGGLSLNCSWNFDGHGTMVPATVIRPVDTLATWTSTLTG